MCGRSGFEASHNVNAAVRGLGVWTLLVRAVYQCLGGFAFETLQADVEARLKGVSAAACAQVHCGINGEISW